MHRAKLCLVLTAVSVAAFAVGGCAGSIYAQLQDAKKAGKPIFIGHLFTGKPDKDGNVGARAQIYNTSHKVFKYVDISVEAYNRVGDVVLYDGHPISKLRFTGPLRPRRTPGMTVWPKVWNAGTIACLEAKRVSISHMDGSTVLIEGPDLANVLATNLNKGCGIG